MIACQVSMIGSLALGVALIVGLADLPMVVMSGVGLLLLLPGLIGGGLAGLMAGRNGALCGTIAALLFGASILAVKILIAPRFGYALASYDLFVYPVLIGGLGLGGALGGRLGARRHRSSPRASTPPVTRQLTAG
jgi:hypothetical protein